jgi:hypothetical protein
MDRDVYGVQQACKARVCCSPVVVKLPGNEVCAARVRYLRAFVSACRVRRSNVPLHQCLPGIQILRFRFSPSQASREGVREQCSSVTSLGWHTRTASWQQQPCAGTAGAAGRPASHSVLYTCILHLIECRLQPGKLAAAASLQLQRRAVANGPHELPSMPTAAASSAAFGYLSPWTLSALVGSSIAALILYSPACEVVRPRRPHGCSLGTGSGSRVQQMFSRPPQIISSLGGRAPSRTLQLSTQDCDSYAQRRTCRPSAPTRFSLSLRNEVAWPHANDAGPGGPALCYVDPAAALQDHAQPGALSSLRAAPALLGGRPPALPLSLAAARRAAPVARVEF